MLERLILNSEPTPVFRAQDIEPPGIELYVKDDGALHPQYGGNKVRKLELILAQALRNGAKRLVTAGPAGSHQGLATAIFGGGLGLPTSAVLIPQPWSQAAEDSLRAALGAGMEPIPVRRLAEVPVAVARSCRAGDYFVPLGGSSPHGTAGYAGAVDELLAQVAQGACPEPDLIVVPLGTGGTAAGLVAGLTRRGKSWTVLGVQVVSRAPIGRALVTGLAAAALRLSGDRVDPRALSRAFEAESRFVGRGYAYPTSAGDSAMRLAEKIGLPLDSTYTAKAFAAAVAPDTRIVAKLRAKHAGRSIRVLYWHTLSSASLKPWLATAPTTLPASLAQLFKRR